MNKEVITSRQEGKKVDVQVRGGGSDTVYGLGVIGAAVYYIKKGTTTEEKVKGFLKALVWPAFLVYELFKFLDGSKQIE